MICYSQGIFCLIKMYKNNIAMKVIDLLKTGSSFLQICIRAGIKADDMLWKQKRIIKKKNP